MKARYGDLNRREWVISYSALRNIKNGVWLPDICCLQLHIEEETEEDKNKNKTKNKKNKKKQEEKEEKEEE